MRFFCLIIFVTLLLPIFIKAEPLKKTTEGQRPSSDVRTIEGLPEVPFEIKNNIFEKTLSKKRFVAKQEVISEFPNAKVKFDENKKVITEFLGDVPFEPKLSRLEAAKKFLSQNHERFGLSENLDELIEGKARDSNPIIFQQSYRGIPVKPGRILVHFDYEKPTIAHIQNEITQFKKIELPIPMDKKEAIELVKLKLKESLKRDTLTVYTDPDGVKREGAVLCIYVYQNLPKLFWRVSMITSDPGASWDGIVNAETHEVEKIHNSTSN